MKKITLTNFWKRISCIFSYIFIPKKIEIEGEIISQYDDDILISYPFPATSKAYFLLIRDKNNIDYTVEVSIFFYEKIKVQIEEGNSHISIVCDQFELEQSIVYFS